MYVYIYISRSFPLSDPALTLLDIDTAPQGSELKLLESPMIFISEQMHLNVPPLRHKARAQPLEGTVIISLKVVFALLLHSWLAVITSPGTGESNT